MTRISATSPSVYKSGDVVELAFSFIGIPIKNNQYKLLTCLRAVVLIDDTLRKVSGRLVIR